MRHHGSPRKENNMPIDQQVLDSFLERAVNDLSASYGGVMVSLGTGWVSIKSWRAPDR